MGYDLANPNSAMYQFCMALTSELKATVSNTFRCFLHEAPSFDKRPTHL